MNTETIAPSGSEHRRKMKREKNKKLSLIMYGYLPTKQTPSGDDAAKVLFRTLEEHQGVQEEDVSKIHRSYGNISRNIECVAQDPGTGAITEIMAVRLQPIPDAMTEDEWVDEIQALLDEQFPDTSPTPIRILGRQPMQHKKFNAEMDVSHRRVEYILPLTFLQNSTDNFDYILQNTPVFRENHRHSLEKTDGPASMPDDTTKEYLCSLKNIMKTLTTKVVPLDVSDKAAVIEKQFHVKKRQRRAKKPGKKQRENDADKESNDNDSKPPTSTGQQYVLRRKRFHNFTPKVMAHEYLAYRRLDRVYHRSTLRYPDDRGTPFLVLSITGDLFLTGQVPRVMGLFLALANRMIVPEFVDLVFDEHYPHLVPTPPAPIVGMVAAEANYMTWEGKSKTILSPRICDRYDRGFNQMGTLQRVKEWSTTVHEAIAKAWLESGEVEGWIERVLVPWAETANKHLEEYRQWLKTRNNEESSALGQENSSDAKTDEQVEIAPPIESVDPSVPELFEKVLYYLRQADASGDWPSTSLKRQLVMVSTEEKHNEKEESRTDSLVVAHMKARNNKTKRASAYSYVEGQGGASGSFSVGAFPGGPTKQPKSNTLFPELTMAAFELERKLCPDREPSSTIAINRNAQFRPHTDSGAGAGQSTSLIVGLGTYSGGELMVEGERRDIRYKAMEFNGWTQRHWTMPFVGERYSLVWFTPKGCEGLRGIDLDLPIEKQYPPTEAESKENNVG